MTQERAGAITARGNPLTLIGPALNAGDKAPAFALTGQDMKPVTLGDSAGKVRLISVVPSLDTPVCDTQTRKFNEKAASLPGVEILTVSMDLPMAQKRWCGAAGIDKVKTASDYKEHNFGKDWGVRIKETGLLARSIFVVGKDDKISYVELVKELTQEPNYDAALEAAKKAAN